MYILAMKPSSFACRLLSCLLLGSAAACVRDVAGPHPGRAYQASVRIVPQLPALSGALADSFALDSIHVVITNARGDTLGIAGVPFPLSLDSVALSIQVELDSAVQHVVVHITILSGQRVIFRQALRMVASIFSGGTENADSLVLVSALWRQLEGQAEIALPGRVGLVAVYDTGQHEIVAFGGGGDAGLSGQTWIYKRGLWQQLAIAGPAPREGHRMAFDAGRGVTVLFGGNTSAGFVNDLWVFDAAAETWTQVSTAGAPSPRGAGVFAHDAGRGRLVLFGGYNGDGFLGETWEFAWTGASSGTWAQVSAGQEPSPRAGTGMVYHAALGRLVLFGGLDSALNALNDTWTYDGTTWTELCVTCAPPVRAAHGMAYDPSGRALVFGGASPRTGASSSVDTTRRNDLWAFDGTSWTQVWANGPSAGPSERAGMAVAFDVARSVLVVISGLSATALESDSWEWSGSAWTEMATAPLSPRSQHAMAYDSRRGVAVMFGGSSADTVTWLFDSLAWRPVAFAGPGARTAPAMAYDSVRGLVVLFAGSGGGSPLADTWLYDGSAWRLDTTATSPPARSGAAMDFDAVRGVIVVFGGTGAAGPLNDTWEYTSPASPTAHGTWRQVTISGAVPSARSGAAFAFDAARGYSVLFGGAGASAETWTYDGSVWTHVTTVHTPSARSGAAIAFEASSRRSVLFGGVTAGARLGDLWAFDGTDWIELHQGLSPAARSDGAMVAWKGGTALLFAGAGASGDLADTWTLR